MGYVELIQQRLQTLSPEKQAEIYDFVEFLATRAQGSKEPDEPSRDWSDAEFSRMAMAKALRGLEDDPVSYTLDDIKDLWQ